MTPQPDTRHTISVGKKWLDDVLYERDRAKERAEQAEAALRQVADAFTRWSKDANDGTYALYRADDRLTYWKDDDLMAACINARALLSAGDNQ